MTSAGAGRPIRVLLLCDSLDTAGGVERFVSRLAESLSERGMAVAIGSVDTEPERLAFPVPDGVRVATGIAEPRGASAACTEPTAAPTGWRILRRQWRTGRVLGRLIAAERPDVLVLNGLATAVSVLALNPGVAARAICCDHNHFDARSRPWRLLRACLYPRVGAVVSLTEADAARFRRVSARVRVIPNASSLSADAPASPARPLVLAVGRHAAQKGFDLLLRAWREVTHTVADATLRIVGDGPLGPELRRLAAELGIGASIEWVSHSGRIEEHFRAAAVFVLPSRYEGMPLALLEAQALGVPAVAFDCPTGPGEIVTPETGIVVAAEDVGGLAHALVALLRDPARRARMGRAAIARSRSSFDPRLQAERWAALIRDVATKDPSDA